MKKDIEQNILVIASLGQGSCVNIWFMIDVLMNNT